MASLSEKIVFTLMKETEIPMSILQSQHPPEVITEQCEPIISNGTISRKDDILFMTSKQISLAKILHNFKN